MPEAVLDALDDFDPARRAAARAEFARALAAPDESAALRGPVNTHFHTFHSFNYRGWSPSRVVAEARRGGLAVAGTVDFDVLDALEETLEAADELGQRAVVSLETRSYWADYADREINSPGEPGVAYTCAAGFWRRPGADSAAGRTLAALRAGAQERNRQVAGRVNALLPDIAVDYDRDVLPLTPGGNATERHLLAAYDAKARAVLGGDARADGPLAGFWAGVLGIPAAEASAMIPDAARFRTAMRAKLMKKGGPGYVQPDAQTFPPIADVFAMARDAEALPCPAWLDGSSAGERDAERLVADYVRAGARAFCLIPDRNWNFADPAKKAGKVAALQAVMAAAKRHHLVFAVGTEMNNYGQKVVDDFGAPELAPFAADFREGAFALWGHTVLGRAADKSMMGAWAKRTFGDDRAAANGFYAEAGRRAGPGAATRERLAGLGVGAGPEEILAALG